MKKTYKKLINKLIKFLMIFTLVGATGAVFFETTSIEADARVRTSSFRSSSFRSSSRSTSSFKSSSKPSSKSSVKSTPKTSTKSKSGYSSKSPNSKLKSNQPSKKSNTSSQKSKKYDGYSSKSPNKPKKQKQAPKTQAPIKVNKNVRNGKQNKSFTNTSKVMNRGSNRTYNTYFSNPYDPFYSGMNFYFYSWLLHSHHTPEQQQIIIEQGIDVDKLNKPEVDTFWITVKSGDEEHLVNVTKAQYDKIKKGEKVTIKKGKVYLDGKELK